MTANGNPVVNWAEGKIWVNNHAHIAEEKEGVLLRYLFHYVQTVNVSDLIHGNIPKLIGGDFRAIKIPVPPIEVQREIVRVLDNFTELTAELTARKQQYEYYREGMIGSGEKVLLSDVATYAKDRINASYVSDETYVGVDNLLPNKAGKRTSDHTPTEGNVIRFLPGDVLIGNIRPYLRKIWLADVQGGTNGDVLVIRSRDVERLIPEYLYYVLSSEDFFIYDTDNSKGAKMPRGDKQAVMKYSFFLPAVNEQRKVVTALNRFSALCSDISVGLPAEINARQKQYEYYRDRLLTFKEI